MSAAANPIIRDQHNRARPARKRRTPAQADRRSEAERTGQQPSGIEPCHPRGRGTEDCPPNTWWP